MLQKYNAVRGQSIYDVCLNVYGTLNLLYKLLQDNNIANANQEVYSRQEFIYDDSLIIDQGINQAFTQTGVRYATDTGKLGSTFYIITGKPPVVNPTVPVAHPDPNNDNTMYKATYSTYYVSNLDGTTIVTLVDKDGASMVGNEIVQIEREIKPLTKLQYSWDSSTAQLTLLGGVTVDDTQTLFVIYQKTITP